MIKQGNNSLMSNRRTGWHWLAGSLFCLLTSGVGAQSLQEPIVNRCATVEHERILQQRDPNRSRQLTELNDRVEQALAKQKSLRQQADNTIYRIPIVVHVVHNTASLAIGGANNGNISEAQIASQIAVLNEDYRRKAGTKGYNTSPIGADAGIEFFLATKDPYGQPTTGITRHYYPQKASFNIFNDDSLLSQIAYWPSDRYLNIWVTTLQDDYLGYTQFPTMADTLKGLPTTANDLTDGSIIDHRTFGRQTGTVSRSLYLLGRTVTHEIGHWLGLIHPWGDGSGCNEDYVADTPPMADGSTAQQTCKQTYSNCDGKGQVRDLMEDYMNYWPDACMNLFTAGQVARMRSVLALSPRRARLIKSVESPLPETENLTLTVYPNPATTDPTVDVQLKGFQSFSVDLYDTAGRQLRTTAYTDSPSTRVSLSVSGLPTGVYIVRVKTDSEIASKRLLVP
ncbi:T9SS type A sorting domain-containing protein [Spirosoma sp. KCTC 42546]|uniref:M43 family zinc metalloprotease n=1 Tax=Spirosoma sp. KCTC 42546 TaxID=2520506 RepID=UPI0011587934|nr:M43 family zinc metalloprotease [Spirosoma sp. KCTC 42546]QDK79847.1 T9SS type A sorting domain-containing protein [Spirosoma sp. KCTC 42546]